jgi:hypothetical protein
LNRFSPQFLEFLFLAKLESGLDAKLELKDETELAGAFGSRKYVEIAKNEGFEAAAESIIRAMWHADKVLEVRHVNPNERKSR